MAFDRPDTRVLKKIWAIVSREDEDMLFALLGYDWRPPDLEIAPDGEPYIYRWHLIPRNAHGANVYLHLQVASDPERPLHDHPWDNQSVILRGGYNEVRYINDEPSEMLRVRYIRKGDVVQRLAHHAHRLVLPDDIPYTISLFSTGSVIRDWGFWTMEGWKSHKEFVEDRDGKSILKKAIQ